MNVPLLTDGSANTALRVQELVRTNPQKGWRYQLGLGAVHEGGIFKGEVTAKLHVIKLL